MSEPERLLGDANDAELISRVRGGDVDAYGALFSRHREAASRLARTLTGSADADDLVSEAFTKVFNVLLGGGGPDIAFRAYLLTAVRRLHVDRVRSTRRATPTDDLSPYDPGVPFHDTVVAGFEGGAAARAFSSLPERWQMVLWHLEVEGQRPADIAPLLGMSANSVSALAYRAREGLRQAFLQMHTADLVGENCRWTHDKLGAYVRNGLSRRDQDKVERHLEECRRCTAIYLELAELNSSLAALVGPLVLGGAAAAYLGGTTVGAGGLVGLGALVGRARDVIVSNSQAAIAAGAAAGLAGAATVGFLVLHENRPEHGTLALSEPGVSQPSVKAPRSHAPHKQKSRTAQRLPGTAPSVAGTSTAPGALTSAGTSSSGATRNGAGGTGGTGPGTGGGNGAVAPAPSYPGSTAPSPPPQQPGHGGGPNGQPSSPPSSKPPAPNPPPSPNPPPDGNPPPDSNPPPGNPTADVSLSVQVTSLARVASEVTTTLGGVPDGATVTLDVTANGLAKLQVTPSGWTCSTPSDRHLVCTAGGGTGSFTLAHPLQGLHLSATASAASSKGTDYTDPDPGNNGCTWDPRRQVCG